MHFSDEINDDLLMIIFSHVKVSDFDAPAVQVAATRSPPLDTTVYDAELVKMVMDISLLWKVCKRWKFVLSAAIPLVQRVRIKNLITHHSAYVVSQADRFVRVLKLHALSASVRLVSSSVCQQTVKNPIRYSFILFPAVQKAVLETLRKAAEDRSGEGRCYRARLSQVVSKTLHSTFVEAFEKTACWHERFQQATCYIWSSATTTTSDRCETILHYDHSIDIAKRLATHYALCGYVARAIGASNPEILHPNIRNVLLKGCERRGNRRILPMSFGMPKGL